jgi:threonine synthase
MNHLCYKAAHFLFVIYRRSLMQYVKHWQCTDCGTEYSVEQPMNLCPKDNRPVKLILDTPSIKADFPDMSWYRPDVKSMWRFGPLLPFDIANEDQKEHIATLGEGYTPVVDMADYPLVKELGLNVFIKDEGQPYEGYGANPTGSFKDRGMAMVASMAKYYGLKQLVVPTQGNAGDSLTEYGVENGFDVTVIMPDDTPMPIMGKVAAYSKIYDGINLALVKGTIREAGALMKEKYLPQGFFNCATFQEPGWRIEGKKTMGLELAEPWSGKKVEWKLPDVVFYPTGGGTGILGMWKAFDELEQIGVISSHRPKIIAIQSDANAPVVDGFVKGLDDSIATDGGQTLATGLNVPGGVGHKAVLGILRESHGGAIAVSEEAIAEHTTAIYRQYNMWISPEGAATVAALAEAKEQGLVTEDDLVVCFNTGSAEKYLPDMRHLMV